MISEKSTKIIRSLVHKKYRQKYNFFIAEGRKIVIDMLKSGFNAIHQLYITTEAFEENRNLLKQFSDQTQIILSNEFSKISNLDSLPDIILIGIIPKQLEIDRLELNSGLHLYLDQIQDPGNLGTIFRTAEWFGVKSIGMSEGCADLFHPKVVQASMGSFCRVPYWIGDIPIPIENNKLNIIGADMNGSSLYSTLFPSNLILAIGNEGQGISDKLRSQIKQYINIPSFSNHIESLNAANAAAIILSEIKRQSLISKK